MRKVIERIDAPLPKSVEMQRKLAALFGDTDLPVRKVFVCSPYAGCVKENVHNARMYSRFVFLCGCMPITPHLMYPRFLEDKDIKERDAGIQMGLILLDFCNEIWVFGQRISNGMRREIAYAEAHGILVRYFSDTCQEVIKRGKG
jgi:hypothetical protein